MKTRAIRSSLSLALCALAQAAVAQATPLYHLADVGLAGQDCQATSSNAQGQVAGYCTSAGVTHTFLYADGVTAELDAGPVSEFTEAINGAGTMVGFVIADGLAQQHATLRQPGGVPVDIGTLGGPLSMLSDINDAGTATGYASLDDATIHPVTYVDGVLHDLGTLGGTYGVGAAINMYGDIAGSSTTADGQEHAFVYSHGAMRDLGTLGGSATIAHAINAKGHVVGSSYALPNSSRSHAFFHDGRRMHDLGRLGGHAAVATGINDSDDIVGYVVTDVGHRAPLAAGFVISHGVSYRVDDVLDASGAGWHVVVANEIDDQGRIVGYATATDGVQHAVLLTPVTP